MSEARQLRKPAATQISQGTPVPTPEVPREPRAATVKKFPNGAIQVLGHDYAILTIKAPPEMTFENALIPDAWVHASSKVAIDTNRRREWLGSLIHLHSANDEWFAVLHINKVVYDRFKQPCGLHVSCVGPSINLKTGEARPIEIATGKAWYDHPKVKEVEAA